MKKKVFLIATVSLLFVAVLSGCSGQSDSGSSHDNKKVINIRIASGPDFLDPHKANASLTFRMLLNVFEGLMNPKPGGGIQPGLATSYKVSDDGLTYTFSLRKHVTFHNGDPMTASDVLYSFHRLMGTKTGHPLSSQFKNVKNIKAPDDHTVIFHLKQPDSAFLSMLTANQAAILSKKNDGKQNNHPVGTGPYQFVKYLPQNKLVLAKYDDYWQEGLPYYEKVNFVFQSDDQAALLSLKSGDIQLTSIAQHKYKEVKDDFHVVKQNTNAVFLLGFNEKRKPFNQLKVRRAINYAVDKDKIISAVFAGFATKLYSHLSPAMGVYYNSDLKGYYETNIQKAKRLMKEAGYADGFQTTITVPTHDNMYLDAAQVIAQQLQKINIKVKIEPVTFAKWLENVYQKRQYDMTIIDFTGYLSPYRILERYRTNASGNMMNYSNPAYDKLMNHVLQVTNKDKRIKMYKRAQRILTEDAAAVYIADYQTIWAMDKNITGFKKYPIFYLDVAHLHPEHKG